MGYQEVKNLIDHAGARIKDILGRADTQSPTGNIETLRDLRHGLNYLGEAVDRLNDECLFPRPKDGEGQAEHIERWRTFLRLPSVADMDERAVIMGQNPGEFRYEYADRVRSALGFPPLGAGRADLPNGAPLICGALSASGRNGEMLACGLPPGHTSPHSWATLPTFDDSGDSDSDRLARHRGEEIARMTAEAQQMRREAGEMNARCRRMDDFFALFRLIVAAQDHKELAKTTPDPYTPNQGATQQEIARSEE